MFVAPLRDDFANRAHGLAHRRAAIMIGIDPDRELYQLSFENFVAGIDINFTLVDPQRVVFDFGNGQHGSARQRATES